MDKQQNLQPEPTRVAMEKSQVWILQKRHIRFRFCFDSNSSLLQSRMGIRLKRYKLFVWQKLVVEQREMIKQKKENVTKIETIGIEKIGRKEGVIEMRKKRGNHQKL